MSCDLKISQKSDSKHCKKFQIYFSILLNRNSHNLITYLFRKYFKDILGIVSRTQIVEGSYIYQWVSRKTC